MAIAGWFQATTITLARETTRIRIVQYKMSMNRGWVPRQGVLETFVDRGLPGLKLDQPRQMAVMHALVRFSHIAAGGTFRTADLYAPVLEALGCSEAEYSLAWLGYDLSKLRAKKLV